MLKTITDIDTIEIEGKNYDVIDFDEIDKKKYHGFIYVTVNKLNGKKYIGQHSTWNKNYLGSGTCLNRAINKYGIENFERFIIDLAESQYELDERETFYINEEWGNIVKSQDWYNIKDGAQNGGDTFAGLSEEEMEKIKEKISEVHKGKIVSEETRKKMRDAQLGKILSKEHRKKISEAQFKAVVIFRNNEYLDTFSSIISAANTLGQTIEGSLENLRSSISQMLNKSWVPKSGRLKGYSAMYLSDYEKLKEGQLKISETILGKTSKSRKGKAVVIFKNGEYLNEFISITNAADALEKTIGGNRRSLKVSLCRMLNRGWAPTRGQLKGYSIMLKEDYEKLQEDQLKIS